MTRHVLQTCSKCGQPIIPADLVLPPVKRRIFDLIRRRPGIDAESLRALAWDDVGGGPETRSNIHVHIFQINRRLRSLGLRVCGSRSGGYRILIISDQSGRKLKT
jgi:hypothetical protein